MSAFDEIEAAVNEASNDNDSSADDEREELAWTKVAPTTVISGDIRRLVYTGVVANGNGVVEQQSYDDGTDGSWAFILDNPSVEKGTIFESNGREDGQLSRMQDGAPSVDYRVFDTDDPNFDESYDSDGNIKGVSNHLTDEFDGSEADDFTEDTIMVFMSSLAGQFITRTLDINGGQSAYITDDGKNTGGLIEYPLDWGDGDGGMVGPSGMYPRVANYPELREDLDGERIFIYLAWRDGSDRAMEGHVGLMGDLEDGATAEDLQSALLGRVRNPSARDDPYDLAWHEGPEDSGSEDESEPANFDLGGDGDTDDTDDSESQFTENEQEFIDEVSGMLEDGDTVDDLFPDFSQTIDKNRSRNRDDGNGIRNTTDVDELRNAINGRNGE